MSFQTTEHGQAGLDSFGLSKPPEEKIRPPQHTIPLIGDAHQFEPEKSPHELRFRDALPEIEGYPWEANIKQFGPAAGIEYWHESSANRYGNRSIEHEDVPPAGDAAALIEGTDRYLSEYALTALDFPSAYSRFGSLESQYRWSVDGLTHITWRFLKRCVRLANGKGRINEEQTSLILCSPGAIVVSGPRGVFRVALWRHSIVANSEPLPEPPEEAIHAIRGIHVPEESPDCRKGLERYIQLREESPYVDITGHEELANDCDQRNAPVAHIFDTVGNGNTIAVTENDLNIVQSHAETRQSLLGVRRHTIAEDGFRAVDGGIFTVTVTPDMLVGAIGDESEVIANDTPSYQEETLHRGTVVGYHSEWTVRKGIRGFGGRKKPTELVFSISVGLMEPSGYVSKHEVLATEFPL